MTGLMTLLADGSRTLPMRRGSWVLRVLLNDPPNDPPPNAGEIQPNTSGKNLTVRQRLELHRSDDVCASCHAKLDPYGLALENYDAIGACANASTAKASAAATVAARRERSISRRHPFKTLDEYKAGLMAQKDRFARAFSTKLLTYASAARWVTPIMNCSTKGRDAEEEGVSHSTADSLPSRQAKPSRQSNSPQRTRRTQRQTKTVKEFNQTLSTSLRASATPAVKNKSRIEP